MQPLKIVVANHDSSVAAQLASSLDKHFRTVSVTRSLDEIRTAIPRQKPELAVIDLETVSLSDVEKLHHDFNNVPIVCTHRLPDEEMWTEALAAGAIDVCQSNDVGSILTAVRRNLAVAQSNAA